MISALGVERVVGAPYATDQPSMPVSVRGEPVSVGAQFGAVNSGAHPYIGYHKGCSVAGVISGGKVMMLITVWAP